VRKKKWGARHFFFEISEIPETKIQIPNFHFGQPEGLAFFFVKFAFRALKKIAARQKKVCLPACQLANKLCVALIFFFIHVF
jgi:hypothetical protein